jgi:peptide/nickel transport system substrate-binding protein
MSAIHTYDKDRDLGTLNRFRYSNPDFDAAIEAATQIFNDAERERAIQAAAVIPAEETAIVPLYFQALSWASKSSVDFDARRDERTLAMGARPAN